VHGRLERGGADQQVGVGLVAGAERRPELLVGQQAPVDVGAVRAGVLDPPRAADMLQQMPRLGEASAYLPTWNVTEVDPMLPA
jgi:hypothetical protein